MLELDQYKFTLNEYRKPLLEVKDSLDIAGKENRIKELEAAMEDQNFWNDVEESNKIMKEVKNLKDTIAEFGAIQTAFDDIEAMIDIAE